MANSRSAGVAGENVHAAGSWCSEETAISSASETFRRFNSFSKLKSKSSILSREEEFKARLPSSLHLNSSNSSI